MTGAHENWARNYTYRAAQIHQPETLEQIRELILRSDKLKALGTRHAFSDIADSQGDLVSLERLNKIMDVDRERHQVTVEAGVRYGQLARWLHAQGHALQNLASLPHISIAGACATATHGSGDRHGNLPTAVAAMELVTGTGEVVILSREQSREQLEGAIVGLGALGVVTRLTLDICPTFQMQQVVYENRPLALVEECFYELTSSAYSVSLFTGWRNGSFSQVWLKRYVPEGISLKTETELFGSSLARNHLHPIPGLSAENCTEQMGICGPWHERLPHFRMDFTPSSGEELQSEYILPRRHAFAAFCAIDRLRDDIAPLLQISEVRTIAADNLWMSPCYKQDCVAIHFTWRKDWERVREVLPLLEDGLSPFGARPHWENCLQWRPDAYSPFTKRCLSFGTCSCSTIQSASFGTHF
jgi:xylitol oxidase